MSLPKTQPIDAKQVKFDTMKTAAEALNSKSYEDMPVLLCGNDHCGGMVSFGGSLNFRLNIFTKEDVCMCIDIQEEFTYEEVN
jgi:hypothetical protein